MSANEHAVHLVQVAREQSSQFDSANRTQFPRVLARGASHAKLTMFSIVAAKYAFTSWPTPYHDLAVCSSLLTMLPPLSTRMLNTSFHAVITSTRALAGFQAPSHLKRTCSQTVSFSCRVHIVRVVLIWTCILFHAMQWYQRFISFHTEPGS